MSASNYNEYMKNYMLRRYYRRKEKAIADLGGMCVRCGSTKNLEFDHVDPNTKSFTLGKSLTSMSEKKIQEELVKCQLLCEGCHVLKSIEDAGYQNAKLMHGTLSSYRYCKCDECRESYNAYRREYKKKHRKNKQGA